MMRYIYDHLFCMLFMFLTGTSPLFAQTILNVYELPSELYFNSAYGLSSDSSSLMLSSGSSSAATAGRITLFDLNGNQTGFVDTQQGSSQGLAWTGTHYWYFKRGTSTTSAFVKLSVDGAVEQTILTGTQFIGGLCWAEGGLWYSLYYPNNEAALYKLDVTTGTVVDTIPTLGQQPQGIAFDGQYYYYAMDNNDGDAENIYIYDPAAGDTVGYIPIADPISTSPRGLAWDGQHLWLVADPVGSAQRALFEIDVFGGGAGNITLTTSELNFGLAEIGLADSLTLNIQNIGAGTLEISNITFDNSLFSSSISAFPLEIPANSSENIRVYFTPDTAGMQTGSLTIDSNDPAEPQVTVGLSGRGMFRDPTIHVSANSHNFGNVWVRQDGIAEWELRVVNEGIETLAIDGYANSNPAFFLESVPIVWNIAPGDTFPVRIYFSPTEAIVYQDTLHLSSSNPATQPAEVALSGTGVGGPFGIGEMFWEYQVPDNPGTSFNEYRPLALKTIADVTGDGVRDVIVCTRNYWTICLDGASAQQGIEVWRFSTYIHNASAGGIGNTNDLPPQQRALAIANDLNGDGFEDVVIGTGGGNERVYALNGRTGEIIWDFGTDDPNQFNLGDITAVSADDDYNGDGINDVLATGSATDGGIAGRRSVYIFDGTNGQQLRQIFVGSFLRMAAMIGDVNNNGNNDLVVGTGDGVANTYAIVAYDPVTTAQLWSFPVGSANGGGRELLRYDVPGETADVIAGAYFSTIYRLDGETGSPVWNFTAGFTGVNQLRLIDDLDSDGQKDVLVSTFSNLFYCVSGADGSVIWQTFLGNFSWSGHATGDLTGDGIPDVLVACRNDNLYVLDGTDGSIFFAIDMKSNMLQGATLIYPNQDLDGNGVPDILGAADDGRVVSISGGITGLGSGRQPQEGVPATLALAQNYPNPFNPQTTIRYQLPQTADVNLKIYNSLGQEVRTLVSQQQAGGYYSVTWDGRDQTGNQVSSGFYFYRLSTGDFQLTRRMLLVR